MIDKQTIATLSLISEIDQPQTPEEKFKNSDKPWHEVDLGKNAKALDTAFIATQLTKEAEDEILSAANSL